jgi:hypothetical protein
MEDAPGDRRCSMKTIVLGYDDTAPAKRALKRTAERARACTEARSMATSTRTITAHTADSDELDRLATDADDDAAQLAMDVESVADACEIVARRVAELRADVARQRVRLADLRGARR